MNSPFVFKTGHVTRLRAETPARRKSSLAGEHSGVQARSRFLSVVDILPILKKMSRNGSKKIKKGPPEKTALFSHELRLEAVG